MLRTLMTSFLILVVVGCGSPPPEVEEIRASSAKASSAKPIEIAADDWSQWRGSSQTGSVNNLSVPVQSVPVEWSESLNVLWKSPVAGVGHSSPIVVRDRLFLTSADQQAETQSVLCFDRRNGKQLWSTDVNTGEFPHKHRKNSFASATPVSDGQLVFVVFVNHQRVQVAALDFEGKIAWETDAGEFQAEHGYGSSPTLFENFLIVNGDSRGGGFLAAIDRSSGDIIWRIQRAANKDHGNYSSPIVVTLAGKSQLIQAGYMQTISYDPHTGDEIWRVAGPATVTGNTPAFSDPYVIISGGYPEKQTLCIKADGSGNVTSSHMTWSTNRNTAYVPSPIIDGENVIVLTDDGIATSFQIESGKKVWQERIGGNYSASPIQVGEHFYVTDEEGAVTVFKGGTKFETVAKNRLDSPGGMATPAVSGNQLFIRTTSDLYCIQGETDSEQSTTAAR